MPDNSPITSAAEDGSPPAAARRGPYRLKTRDGLRNACASMIRQAMGGQRPVEECSKIVAMLRTLDEMLAAGEFDSRLAQLERAAGVSATVRAERVWQR